MADEYDDLEQIADQSSYRTEIANAGQAAQSRGGRKGWSSWLGSGRNARYEPDPPRSTPSLPKLKFLKD